MGLLALHQLLYFSSKRPKKAMHILMESNNPSRYFPFATVGINFTAFIMELFEAKRFHSLLFVVLERSSLLDSDTDVIDSCCEKVHDIYCDLWEQFITLWVARNPSTGVMAFPGIYEELKIQFKCRFPSIS
jgi:hypothetical protein